MPDYLTLPETLAILRVSRTTLYRMIGRGDLPVSRVGKSLRFLRSDVESCFKGGNP